MKVQCHEQLNLYCLSLGTEKTSVLLSSFSFLKFLMNLTKWYLCTVTIFSPFLRLFSSTVIYETEACSDLDLASSGLGPAVCSGGAQVEEVSLMQPWLGTGQPLDMDRGLPRSHWGFCACFTGFINVPVPDT